MNKVILTGSAATGRAVLENCAPSLTPAAMELSGCDAAFILDGADVPLAAKCLALSLTWNGSATCVAARRVFVHHTLAAELRAELTNRVSTVAPVACDRAAAVAAEELIEDALNRGAKRLCGTIDHRPDPPRAMPVVLDDVPGKAEILPVRRVRPGPVADRGAGPGRGPRPRQLLPVRVGRDDLRPAPGGPAVGGPRRRGVRGHQRLPDPDGGPAGEFRRPRRERVRRHPRPAGIIGDDPAEGGPGTDLELAPAPRPAGRRGGGGGVFQDVPAGDPRGRGGEPAEKRAGVRQGLLRAAENAAFRTATVRERPPPTPTGRTPDPTARDPNRPTP